VGLALYGSRGQTGGGLLDAGDGSLADRLRTWLARLF